MFCLNNMNRQETIALLEQFNLKPTKSLGQNFLIDDRITAKAVAAAAPDENTCVIEIGPGLGGLSTELAKKAGSIKTVEIDRHILPALKQVVLPYPNIEIIHADAMQVDFSELTADWPGSVCVAANLPYYITSPIVEKLLSEIRHLRSMTLLVQKEAASRLAAKPGSKLYGPAAVLTALLGPVKKICQVSAASFYPRPHVDSVLIHIGNQLVDNHPKGNQPVGKQSADNQPVGNHLVGNQQEEITTAKTPSDWINHHACLTPDFLLFMNHCFARRRKTLANSLRDAGWRDEKIALLVSQLAEIGLNTQIRPEALQPEQYADLFLRLR